MTILESFDPHDWRTIGPLYAALSDERLTAEDIPGWLDRWSSLEKSVLEAWTLLKRPAYRDTADQAAVEGYEAFTREMFSTHKALTEALARKWLAFPEGEAGAGGAMRRRMREEAALFRPENVALHAEISDLVAAYRRLPGGGGADEDDAARWLRQREQVNALFLKTLALRRRLARNAGLPDYRAYRWRELGRLDYTPASCQALHTAIEDAVVPAIAQMEGTLSPPPPPRFDDAPALERAAQAVLDRVDSEIGALFSEVRDGYLDLGPRPGKRGGDEEWFFPVAGRPYLHINSLDLFTVVHECGHGLHDALSLRQQGLFWAIGGPEEFQEFAALALQTLAYPCLSTDAGGPLPPAQADAARDANVWLCLQALPRLARDDAFQHWVYGDAPEDVTAAGLDARWLELTRRYLPAEAGGDHDIVKTGWQRWAWSLFASPFYMVSYLGGVLGAWQVWRRALADRTDATRAYKGALALGHTRPLPELYRAAGASWSPGADDIRDLVGFVVAHLRGTA